MGRYGDHRGYAVASVVQASQRARNNDNRDSYTPPSRTRTSAGGGTSTFSNIFAKGRSGVGGGYSATTAAASRSSGNSTATGAGNPVTAFLSGFTPTVRTTPTTPESGSSTNNPARSVGAAMRARHGTNTRHTGYVAPTTGQRFSSFQNHFGTALKDKMRDPLGLDQKLDEEALLSGGAGLVASTLVGGLPGLLLGGLASAGTKAAMRTRAEEEGRRGFQQNLDRKMDWATVGKQNGTPIQPQNRQQSEEGGEDPLLPWWWRRGKDGGSTSGALMTPTLSKTVQKPKTPKALQMYNILPMIHTGAYDRGTYLNLRNTALNYRRRQRPGISGTLGG